AGGQRRTTAWATIGGAEMKKNRKLFSRGVVCTLVLLALALVGRGRLRTIEADTTQVRQLFQNLIGTALKFDSPGAPPVVKVENDLLCDPIKGTRDSDRDLSGHEPAKTLYVWAGDPPL